MTQQKKYVYSNLVIYNPKAVKDHPTFIQHKEENDEDDTEDELTALEQFEK